jgi:hypothetical protein
VRPVRRGGVDADRRPAGQLGIRGSVIGRHESRSRLGVPLHLGELGGDMDAAKHHVAGLVIRGDVI